MRLNIFNFDIIAVGLVVVFVFYSAMHNTPDHKNEVILTNKKLELSLGEYRAPDIMIFLLEYYETSQVNVTGQVFTEISYFTVKKKKNDYIELTKSSKNLFNVKVVYWNHSLFEKSFYNISIENVENAIKSYEYFRPEQVIQELER